ncbi:MAG: hypothetical protein ACRD1E_08635, partial [Terriglobales bacterium]
MKSSTRKPLQGPAWRWLVLALAAAACLGLYLLTARAPAPAQQSKLDSAITQRLDRDQALFQSANALAPEAVSAPERALAAQAQHLSDEVVDASFAIALARLAAQPPPPPSAAAAAAAAR